MTLKKGDFIEVEYTARLKESGDIFDSTDEKLAKELGFHSPTGLYGPLTIKLGEAQVLRGLDDALTGKPLGKHVLEFPPEKAFGHKNPKLVHLIPLKRFHEHNINPVPGLRLNIDGMVGTVRSTSGGRVLVDFNHPLAGKDVVYDVAVKRLVEDPAERVKAMLRLGNMETKAVEVRDGKAHVALSHEPPKAVAEMLGKKLTELTGMTVSVAAKQEAKQEKEGAGTSGAGAKA
jgi:FKBP-type peptidyl-prolyl cis-trans isomerase 2